MATSPATLSVALCSHNGARFIAEQVASIVGQEPRPTEIVLSDDASTDDTIDIVRGEVTAVPLTVLRNDHALGVTANFEQAVRAASGDLIALSDQDDVWRSGRLASIAALFEADPGLLLVASDARLVDAHGLPTGSTLWRDLGVTAAEEAALVHGDAFSALLRRNLVTGATVVFRRELLASALPFPPAWVHDEWLAIMAAVQGGLRAVPDQLIDYRQHGANQIGVERLGLRGRLRRLREPRAARNARLLERAEVLNERLAGMGGTVAARVAAKARHEAARSALPAFPPARIVGVTRLLIGHGYRDFGRGLQDAVRDLVQSAR